MPARGKAYAGFAAFGAFWGAWGASVPAIRDQAGVTDGQLGTALLFIGTGAVPAMLLAGRAVDRWHERATAALLTLFGLAGVVVVLAAHDFPGLALSLVLLGATSGAADVAINTAAGAAQRTYGGPVIGRAHAAFSAAVVVASLATGGLHAVGLPVMTAFVAVAAAAVAAAAMILGGQRGDSSAPGDDAATSPGDHAISSRARNGPSRRGMPPPRNGALAPGARSLRLGPLFAIGGLGALAFAVENSHQSWSALYLRDVVGAGAAIAAAGPAVFAGVVAVTRLATAEVSSRRPGAVLVGGAVVAGAGTALVAAAGTLAVALGGLALAAAGTAVLFPTLIVVLTARVPDRVRGTATSAVTTVAYLGFLAGPPYVGAWADAVGLPGAMLAVAALALVLAPLAAVSVGPRNRPRGERARRPAAPPESPNTHGHERGIEVAIRGQAEGSCAGSAGRTMTPPEHRPRGGTRRRVRAAADNPRARRRWGR
jgi:predicted MFS family arabinose efflux permease